MLKRSDYIIGLLCRSLLRSTKHSHIRGCAQT
uniref:Uncharacterized protein n=1 Tax=Anguilla anguilla TaxID=7936 RepID=A0A0E9QIX5_ANGAN